MLRLWNRTLLGTGWWAVYATVVGIFLVMGGLQLTGWSWAIDTRLVLFVGIVLGQLTVLGMAIPRFVAELWTVSAARRGRALWFVLHTVVAIAAITAVVLLHYPGQVEVLATEFLLWAVTVIAGCTLGRSAASIPGAVVLVLAMGSARSPFQVWLFGFLLSPDRAALALLLAIVAVAGAAVVSTLRGVLVD